MRKTLPLSIFLPLISACHVLPGLDAAATGVRILCGIADIVISEADIPKIESAFAGNESYGKKVCRAFRAYSENEQQGNVPVSDDETTILRLPSGESIEIKVLPPTSE